MSARGQDTIIYNKALYISGRRSKELKINSYPLSEVGLFLVFVFHFMHFLLNIIYINFLYFNFTLYYIILFF